jgi:hypothetical protein
LILWDSVESELAIGWRGGTGLYPAAGLQTFPLFPISLCSPSTPHAGKREVGTRANECSTWLPLFIFKTLFLNLT